MRPRVTELRARPVARELDPAVTALVVIDMQRDFLEPGGFGEALGNDVGRLSGIVPAVRRLLAAFRASGLPVFHTVEGHRPDLSDCPPAKRAKGAPGLRIGDPGPMGRILILGEHGNAPIEACVPRPGERVIAKPGKGAFYRTDLEAELTARGITTVVLCGVTAEVCVQTTAREACDRGFEVILVEDATASYIEGFREAVVEMVVSQGGIVGWSTLTDDLVYSLLSAGLWRPRVTWSELRPGLQKASLGVEPDGWEAAFLSYQPGAFAPLHRHRGTEHLIVLEGSQADHRGPYYAPTTVTNLSGTEHRVDSPDGCLLFIDWEAPVEFLEGR